MCDNTGGLVINDIVFTDQIVFNSTGLDPTTPKYFAI